MITFLLCSNWQIILKLHEEQHPTSKFRGEYERYTTKQTGAGGNGREGEASCLVQLSGDQNFTDTGRLIVLSNNNNS